MLNFKTWEEAVHKPVERVDLAGNVIETGEITGRTSDGKYYDYQPVHLPFQDGNMVVNAPARELRLIQQTGS